MITAIFICLGGVIGALICWCHHLSRYKFFLLKPGEVSSVIVRGRRCGDTICDYEFISRIDGDELREYYNIYVDFGAALKYYKVIGEARTLKKLISKHIGDML